MEDAVFSNWSDRLALGSFIPAIESRRERVVKRKVLHWRLTYVTTCGVIIKTKISCKACGGSGTHWIVEPRSLKQTRMEAGISLRQMAKKLHFSAPYLSDVENGRRACTLTIESAYSELSLAKKTRRKKK